MANPWPGPRFRAVAAWQAAASRAKLIPTDTPQGRVNLHLLPLLLLCLASAPAAAGGLYRCTGSAGETVYTSTRTGYANCKAMATPAPEPARPATTAASANVAVGNPGKGRVEFRTAPGDAEPKAVSAPSSARVNRGAVYRYTRDGVVHYTNRKPAGQAAKVLFSYIETCFACGVASGVNWNNVGLNTGAFASEIAEAVAAHGVEEALVRAVIHAESAFRHDAVSRVGAQGLMQLMPATAARFGVGDAFAPADNIRGGTTYLAWLMKRFNGDVRLATAAYNAGEGAVDKYDGVPPYNETQRYVERVAILRDRYRAALTPTTAAVTPTVSAGSP